MDVIDRIKKEKKIFAILLRLTADEIERAIEVASDSYYNKGISLLSDEDFDNLVERLKLIKPSSKYLKKTGAPVKGKKVKLPIFMSSMDKVKSNSKIIGAWINEYEGPYVRSDKLDGISCLMTFDNEKYNLYTKGDSVHGQDISHLMKMCNMFNRKNNSKSVANNIKNSGYNRIIVRAEFIISKNKFKKYEGVYSNARNMVGGIVNSKISSININEAKDVDFVAYELIEPVMKNSEQLEFLEMMGFETVSYDIYDEISLEILDNLFVERKRDSEYEVDGIIVTDDNIHPRPTSGNPPYAFAYKGMTATANVKVLSVIWDPSKDGILVPTIHFVKVNLSQADLEYTLGFNAKTIIDNGIGPGATITIIRSGDVIPYIIGVVKPSKKLQLPKEEYVWDQNKVNIILKNPNNNKRVIIKRLKRFVKTIGIDDLSEGNLTKIVDAGHTTIQSIIDLTVDDLLQIDGFKDKMANKIYNNIQNSINNIGILKLMVSSNIFGRGFAEKKLGKILEVYPHIVDSYESGSYDIWLEKIKAIEGFDTITAKAFLTNIPKFQEFYLDIKNIINVEKYKKKKVIKGKYNGMVFTFTGFRDKAAKNIIEENGGKVLDSFRSETTHLVYQDGKEGSNSYQKAIKKGIIIIPRSIFNQQYL